ncbi:uncharacterized protein K02A2.6-like [Armigeres subalbatus]|uniref:uncharacterized protein K02A2.6-like n=1 Tax=Armigeres subalbatus TaxID=124917 RepID=UPI002ED3A515
MADSAAGLKPPKPLVLGDNMADQWRTWYRQFKWFSVATQLDAKPSAVQAATLLSAIGVDCVRIFDTFGLRPDQEDDIDVIVQKFNEYFTPKSCTTYERYHFNKIMQKEEEAFDVFVTRVREQAKKCAFSVLHDSLVKDKLIVGTRFTKIVPQLLNDDLTLQKTIELCRNFELTSIQTKELNKEDKVEVLKSVKRQDEPKHRREEAYECNRCGRKHKRGACPAYDKTCNACGWRGHFAVMCKAKKRLHKNVSEVTEQVSQREETDAEEFYIHALGDQHEDDWFETIYMKGRKLSVKLDTGAQCNVLPASIVEKLPVAIESSATKNLVTYNGQRIPVIGEISSICLVKGRSQPITFKIVKENVTPVLGRKTCLAFDLIARVNTVGVTDSDIYDGLGCLRDFVYDIDLVDAPSWEIRPSRNVPHSIRDEVRKELSCMEALGVIAKIHEPTPVVNAMVLVRKKGKLRICIDPSQVNQNILRRHHPLTTIEEIVARLKGSKRFTILDCKRGFWQIQVTERTSKYLTFGTPWGRYCCKRLPFGLASAPEIFQNVMQGLVGDIDGVECSMDDILIHARNSTELMKITDAVISRINKAGLKLNREKCIYDQASAKFLGHIISANGLQADDEKLEAIRKLSIPVNKQQLQRALGMITYLGKFIKNLSDITAPLRALLVKDVAWVWGVEQNEAFEQIKNMMISPPILAFYDVNAPVTLSVDASSKAMGAVLLQRGKPVAYASKSLSPAERNYPQIEKEAAAIRFACQKFHQYIYGKDLTIESDHKPLESIFRKPLDRAPPRLKRIRLDVEQYSPKVVYVRGRDIPIPDILSRDVANSENEDVDEELEVHIVLQMSKRAASELRDHAAKDSEIQLLKQVIMAGWPDRRDDVEPIVRKFWCFRDELSVYEGIVFKANQVMIPKTLRKKMLTEIHNGHPGLQSCVKRAKQILFWINMTSDIQQMVDECQVCQMHQPNNTKQTIISKEIPSLPFERVATDLFHFKGKEYILLVDSYSSFFDFKELPDMSSRTVITTLKEWFAVHGVPAILESDNGPQYSSEEFKAFAVKWNFDHETSSPHFPRANGLAERYVQTAKHILKKCAEDESDVQLALLHARNTPRSTELPAPSERLMGRLTRTNLPATDVHLQPRLVTGISGALAEARKQQKQYADRGAVKGAVFQPGDAVLLQNCNTKTWKPATVVNCTDGRRSYVVRDEERTLRRNSHHLRPAKIVENEKPAENLQAAVQHQYPIFEEDHSNTSETETSDTFAGSRFSSQQLEETQMFNNDDDDNQQQTTRSGRLVKQHKLDDYEYY